LSTPVAARRARVTPSSVTRHDRVPPLLTSLSSSPHLIFLVTPLPGKHPRPRPSRTPPRPYGRTATPHAANLRSQHVYPTPAACPTQPARETTSPQPGTANARREIGRAGNVHTSYSASSRPASSSTQLNGQLPVILPRGQGSSPSGRGGGRGGPSLPHARTHVWLVQIVLVQCAMRRSISFLRARRN
jgi:hypothetical protein